MEILSFDQLPSTQRYLQEAIADKSLRAPVAVIAAEQTAGVGSRENEWDGGRGNFFASVALPLALLPGDLPLSSASIYFSFIMKKVLQEFDQNVWIKWPNDFYKNDEKVGGAITHKVGQTIICGIGINLKKTTTGYSALQCDISPEMILKKYVSALSGFPKWKQIFSEYKIEFELSRKFSAHIENDENATRTSLSEAQLCEDGSILLKGKKVYSLR